MVIKNNNNEMAAFMTSRRSRLLFQQGLYPLSHTAHVTCDMRSDLRFNKQKNTCNRSVRVTIRVRVLG